MGQVLYRKHRPRSLSKIVGQEHITDTLVKALKQGRISHAYLLTGPRGVGKTSVARILAHEINGLPYEDDSQHIDIIEIDAASNRRIDEIRELRDKVYVAPTSAKYKVYIIDEVHMLTREAFNALLKTLEEPPAHVIFILATTDAHKLPETIISRTQRFSFRPVDKDKVVEHLKTIAKQEKIKVSDEALELLAEHGEGSFRDSISLLDQASSNGQALEAGDVRQLLGIPPGDSLEAVLALLSAGDSAKLVSQVSGLYDQGYQAAAIAKQLAQLIRTRLIGNELSMDRGAALELLGDLIAVPAAHDPERYLEISLLRAQKADLADAIEVVESTAVEAEEIEEPAPAKEEIPEPRPTVETPTAPSTLDGALWPQILGALKRKHNTLYSVVRMAQPTFGDGALTLAFAFAFHQKRLNEAGNRKVLAQTVEELTGKTVRIECIVDKAAKPDSPKVERAEAPVRADISAISNIFGGAELLES